MRRRLQLVALLLFVALPIAAQTTTCPDFGCDPAMKDDRAPGGWTRNVYLDPSVDAATRNNIIAAINMWNQWFTSMNEPPPFQITSVRSFGPWDVAITVDPTMHNTFDAAITENSVFMRLNPDFLGRTSFVGQVLRHELGHCLGYMDIYDVNCRNQTIMYGVIDPAQHSFLLNLTQCDRDSLRTHFPPLSNRQNGGGVIADGGTDGVGSTADPLILDLTGDGVQTSGTDDLVRFDIDGNGTRERITWTARVADEAFLWVDLNSNGIVDDGRELFGVGTVLPDGTRARNGFEALAMYDTPAMGGNGDGVIDDKDAVWRHLRLWLDKNHDATSQRSEVDVLQRFGIQALLINAHVSMQVDASGNVHSLKSQYIKRVTGHGPPSIEYRSIDALNFQVFP